MKFRRHAATVAGGVLLLSGIAVSVSPSAFAIPGNCTFSGHTGGTSASARCTSGTGKFRVWVECEDELRGSAEVFDGPWTAVGGTSRVSCPNWGGTQWLITTNGGYDREL